MSAVDIALVVARLAIGCWLLWSVRTLKPPARSIALSSVSVVVPARDEEHSLPHLLASLPDEVEVVVVDDGSSDATAAIAAAAGARVVTAGDVPEGWVGKPWACARGADAATGDTLVFVDADVTFGPGGLEAVVARSDACHGLVSVQPHHVPVRWVEHLALVCNVVAFAGTDAGTPLGARRGARGAFGPVLAISRADYRRVGGHHAVRSAIIEDVELGERSRAAGLDVDVLVGGGVGAAAVRFRMYPEGLGQLVEGFTKNLAGGLGAIRRTTAALVGAWITLLVQATVAPLRAVDAATLAAPAALYALVAAQVWWMGRRVGRFGFWAAALFPVPTALFLYVFARSVVATVRGSVSWRGRRVPTGRRRDPGR